MKLGTGERYTNVAILLHWLIVLLIIAGASLGLTLDDMPFSPQKLKFFSWHKWIGITVLLLALVRLLWRATHRPPALPAGLPPLEVRLAAVGHALLYVLLLAIPLSGWAFSGAKGVKVVYLGVLPLPDLVGKDAALAETLHTLHGALNLGLALLVAAHVAAVVKHLFFDGHDVLYRMLPRHGRPNRTQG